MLSTRCDDPCVHSFVLLPSRSILGVTTAAILKLASCCNGVTAEPGDSHKECNVFPPSHLLAPTPCEPCEPQGVTSAAKPKTAGLPLSKCSAPVPVQGPANVWQV